MAAFFCSAQPANVPGCTESRHWNTVRRRTIPVRRSSEQSRSIRLALGCQATVTGTGLQFESPAAVLNALGSMLEDQGWTADPMLVAGGPIGTAAGYRKGDQICAAAAMWEPDESANCPEDQPISACQVTPEQQNYTVTPNGGVETPEG